MVVLHGSLSVLARWIALHHTGKHDESPCHLLPPKHDAGVRIDRSIGNQQAVAVITNSLQEFRLKGTQITAAGLVHLKGLTNLRTLYLEYTQVNSPAVAELQKALPNCRINHYAPPPLLSPVPVRPQPDAAAPAYGHKVSVNVRKCYTPELRTTARRSTRTWGAGATQAAVVTLLQ